jgi:hypothetical protein
MSKSIVLLWELDYESAISAENSYEKRLLATSQKIVFHIYVKYLPKP